MTDKVLNALPSHLKNAVSGDSANGEAGKRHHGKSQSHVVSPRLLATLVSYVVPSKDWPLAQLSQISGFFWKRRAPMFAMERTYSC